MPYVTPAAFFLIHLNSTFRSDTNRAPWCKAGKFNLKIWKLFFENKKMDGIFSTHSVWLNVRACVFCVSYSSISFCLSLSLSFPPSLSFSMPWIRLPRFFRNIFASPPLHRPLTTHTNFDVFWFIGFLSFFLRLFIPLDFYLLGTSRSRTTPKNIETLLPNPIKLTQNNCKTFPWLRLPVCGLAAFFLCLAHETKKKCRTSCVWPKLSNYQKLYKSKNYIQKIPTHWIVDVYTPPNDRHEVNSTSFRTKQNKKYPISTPCSSEKPHNRPLTWNLFHANPGWTF